MKRAVIVAPDFPPSSLPPAIRARFFANNLKDFGWEVTVVSTKPEFYNWPVDPENYRLIDDSVEVVRTEAWKTSWTRKLGIGDVGIRSLVHQWRELKLLCEAKKVDVLCVPVPPYVSMILGRLAYEKFKVPYVIDYIDPWVTDYYWKVPKAQRPPKWPLAYALSRLVEPIALKKVGHITGVSQGTTDGVVTRYKHLTSNNATEIPYGAEPADFEYIRRHPRANPVFQKDDGLFHLSYVGACIPGMFPTVEAIFSAVRKGLDRNADQFSRLRLHFVGTSYAPGGSTATPITAISREYGLESIVDELPSRVSYLESLQIMIDSDALFLVGSDEPHYTASKMFPYLLASKPLLSVFHEASTVVEILAEYPHAEVVSYKDAKTLQNDDAILCALTNVLRADPNPIVNAEKLAPFTTKAMAGRLAVALDKAIAREQPVGKFVTRDQEHPTSA